MINDCRVLIFLSCFLVSCQLTKGGKTVSSWDKLEQAKSLSCKEWETNQDELEISELYPVDLLGRTSFVVSGRSRSGAHFHYVTPVRGKAINHKQKNKLEWGFGAEYLGSIVVQGEAGVLLETRLPNGKRRLEIRDLERNIIKYKSAERDAAFRSHHVVTDVRGFWLAYKREKSDESIEDQPYQFVRFEWSDKGELKAVSTPRFSPTGDILMVSLPNEKVLGVLLDTGTSVKQKPASFHYFILGKGQNQPRLRPLNLEISERVESWSIARNEAGIILSYVTGDTLLWENASLQIVRLDEHANIMQRQGFEINNEHVGDPILVSTGAAIYLFLSKWLDSDSTLAVYRISTTDIEDRGLFGVFPEGTYLENAFYSSSARVVFLITQAPAGYTRRYSYCTYQI